MRPGCCALDGACRAGGCWTVGVGGCPGRRSPGRWSRRSSRRCSCAAGLCSSTFGAAAGGGAGCAFCAGAGGGVWACGGVAGGCGRPCGGPAGGVLGCGRAPGGGAFFLSLSFSDAPGAGAGAGAGACASWNDLSRDSALAEDCKPPTVNNAVLASSNDVAFQRMRALMNAIPFVAGSHLDRRTVCPIQGSACARARAGQRRSGCVVPDFDV
jgi:hypothetical protein